MRPFLTSILLSLPKKLKKKGPKKSLRIFSGAWSQRDCSKNQTRDLYFESQIKHTDSLAIVYGKARGIRVFELKTLSNTYSASTPSDSCCLKIGRLYDRTYVLIQSMFLRTREHVHNKVHSMKTLSCYPGNATARLSVSMKSLGCYMGNRLTAVDNSYVGRMTPVNPFLGLPEAFLLLHGWIVRRY